MKRQANRRAVLVAAGLAAAAAATGAGAEGPADLRGTVTFDGGAPIPAGEVEIYIEDLAGQDVPDAWSARTRVESDGKSEKIGFSVALPEGSAVPPTLEIVARLERADGWLLARGSAPFEAGSAAHITLNAAIY